MMTSSFDDIAISYCNSLMPMPKEYVNRLSEIFQLSLDKQIVELGCGNGLLSSELSIFQSNIIGLDISQEMINLASENNFSDNVEYICADVFDYDYKKNYYDLIISYESIHLFEPIDVLIRKAYEALKCGGFLCMGWCEYNWEIPLRYAIVDTFEQNGVYWGTWGFSKHYPFFDCIANHGKFDNVMVDSVEVNEAWSIEQVVSYLLSISKSVDLSKSVKEKIRTSLLKKFDEIGDIAFKGKTKYCVAYTKKIR